MTQLELVSTSTSTSTSISTGPPLRPRHVNAAPARRPPLFVWPIVAMVAMLPVLATLILLLVT